jgi:hypothetical protein
MYDTAPDTGGRKTARNFARAAKARAHTPYSLLHAAAKPQRRTWKKHFEWLGTLGMKPMPYGLIAAGWFDAPFGCGLQK